MPGDSYHIEATFRNPRARCWDVLTDVSTLASWVGVLHSVETIVHLRSYRAVLEDRVGPVRLRAPLDVDVEVHREGAVARLRAEGKDTQVNSSISIDVAIELVDLESGGTQLVLDASYAVLGKVASMGSGIVKKKADKILSEFVAAAERELG